MKSRFDRILCYRILQVMLRLNWKEHLFRSVVLPSYEKKRMKTRNSQTPMIGQQLWSEPISSSKASNPAIMVYPIPSWQEMAQTYQHSGCLSMKLLQTVTYPLQRHMQRMQNSSLVIPFANCLLKVIFG